MKKLLLVLIIFTTSVFSQQKKQLKKKKQPKIGLVLSGGGAKGFAHIGVLKEIEKAGVQIDYIGGTSMGAIVGGLYASGYTPNQIEEKIQGMDFENLIQDNIPRKDIPLFDKEHQEKYSVSLPITKNGIKLPQGVSKGQNIHNYFTELFSVVDSINDFKKLPIPFFCIATDIETGEKVILEKGNLAKSVRASGAFPTLLHPVKVGNRLLIDGGVADNFPAKELRKRGADIIIGLDVQGELVDRKKLGSVLDLLNQIIAFQIYEDAQEQRDEVDIYIHPDVKDYTVISFDDSSKIIENGEKKARDFQVTFDSIAKLQTNKKVVKKHNLSKNPKFCLEQVNIQGNKKYNEDYILGTLNLKLCDSINYSTLSKSMNKLTGTKNFSDIDYNLENLNFGKVLNIKLNESEINSFLKLGLHYDQIYGLNILTNYTHKRLLAKNDMLSFDFIFGNDIRYDFNYFIDNGFHLGLGFKSSYNSFATNVFFGGVNVNKLNVKFSELLNRFYVQTKFNKKYALTLGTDLRTLKATSETVLNNGKPVIYENSNYALTFANIKLDNFNKPYFPTKGFYFSSTFDYVFFSDRNTKNSVFIHNQEFRQFTQLKSVLSVSNTIINKFTFQYTFEGGVTMANLPTDAFAYKIGGYNRNLPNAFIPFYGFEVAEYMKNNFVKAGGDFRYNFYKKHHLTFGINFIKMGKKNFLKDNIFDNMFSGNAVGYGLETFLGPLELKYSWSNKSNKSGRVLFNVGFWF